MMMMMRNVVIQQYQQQQQQQRDNSFPFSDLFSFYRCVSSASVSPHPAPRRGADANIQ